MATTRSKPPVSFLAFFLLWAERMRWDVPPLHVRVCIWMERVWLSGSDLWLLMLPRGHAKSTILEVFNAWVYLCDRTLRILHQSEADGTALKTSRGTQNVLRHHPLTIGLYTDDGAVEQWWLNGAKDIDPRNASMYAKGILSNVTSSRADLIQNDDIEVPKNIGTVEAREKLRFRLGEQVHIGVPGCPHFYIGTPHTHDSIYEDVKRMGAEALIVRMFGKEHRIESATLKRYPIPFRPEYVFSGIGEGSRLLRPGVDYRYEGGALLLASPGGELVDCYADAAWPERFDRDELAKRRKKTRTINEWDSQYQLHAKPVANTRLDPERIVAYEVEPLIRYANNASSLWLGGRQLTFAAARWDPSSGKLKSDASAFGCVYQDDDGRRYIHRVKALSGEIAEFADDGKTITGGQVWQLCDEIEDLSLARIEVETNGIGQFAPAVLRAALRQRKIPCGVVEVTSTTNKNKRILETMEPLLLSRGMLWAHVSVLDGPLWEQMRAWNPAVKEQADDYVDAVSGAIASTPERVKAKGGIPQATARDDWRPGAGTFDAEFDSGR